jgi:hypothetical protein
MYFKSYLYVLVFYIYSQGIEYFLKNREYTWLKKQILPFWCLKFYLFKDEEIYSQLVINLKNINVLKPIN